MSDFFSKSIDAVEDSDILGLLGTPESQIFEIKETLASEKGSSDPWFTKQGKAQRKGPGDYAKQSIFREIVAFANVEGGWLVLGVKEASGQAKVAGTLSPLPACKVLADRLERAAHDWIDPPLPSLRCVGVEISGETGEGVVVFRVPRSSLAPHRVYKANRTQEAFKRVNDESKPMLMREIQDMTLDRARGLALVESHFEEARRRLTDLFPMRFDKDAFLAFYAILVPTTGPLILDRPYLSAELFARELALQAQFTNGRPFDIGTMDRNAPGRTTGKIEPILRGGRRRWSSAFPRGRRGEEYDEYAFCIEVLENGLVTLAAMTTDTDTHKMFLGDILADLANALSTVQHAREIARSPDAEYALEIDLSYRMKGEGWVSLPTEIEFGVLDDEERTTAKIDKIPLTLGRYRVSAADEFPELLRRIMNDFLNLVHKAHRDDVEFLPRRDWTSLPA